MILHEFVVFKAVLYDSNHLS